MHPTSPKLVAAAAAVGLLISHDGGETWKVLSEGADAPHALAVAVLADEVLFSVQEDPFAKKSQIWRWRIGGQQLEQVREGLPQWLDGKVDTAHISTNAGKTAILDGGGNLYLSKDGSRNWQLVATGLENTFGVMVL